MSSKIQQQNENRGIIKPHNRAMKAYLADLNTQHSRSTQIQSFKRAAKLMPYLLPQSIVGEVHASDLWEYIEWDDLTYEDVQFLKTQLKEKYKPATVNVTLAAIRKVIEHAFRLEIVPNETLARVQQVKDVENHTLPSGRHIEFLEIQAMFYEAAQTENVTRRYRDLAILTLLYGTGMRRSEVAKLQVTDYNRRVGEFHLKATKRGKERKVYVTGAAKRYIDNWLDIRGAQDGAFFWRCHKSGRLITEGISAQSVYNLVKHWAQQAELDNVEPHSFRRTYIGELLDSGVDIATIAQNVGHADVNTTRRYDRRGERAQMDSAKKVEMPDI